METDINKKQTEDSKTQAKSSIEQIREILFGEKAAEWERRLNTIIEGIRLLDEKLIELEKRLAEMGVRQDSLEERYLQSDASWTQLHDLVKLMDKDLNLKIAHLDDIKTDRELIAKAFGDWAQKIRQASKE